MKDIEDEAKKAATKIQACWRGYHTRKQLHEVQIWYKETFLNIENENMEVKFSQEKVLQLPQVSEFNESMREGASPDSSTTEVPELLMHEMTVSDDVKANENSLHVTSKNEMQQLKTSKADLISKKQDIVMELFWVQQAIESRRNYLLLKNNISS